MINLAKICLVITVFGQLAYNAAIYYVQFPHPSYPVWGVMYLATASLFFSGQAPRQFAGADWLYFACMVWMVLSFVISGESDSQAFFVLMALFVIPPYVVGRFLGRYFTASDFRKVYILAAVMLTLMIVEYVRNPASFQGGERLYVFAVQEVQDPLQGGTAFYIASLFGSAFVIAFSMLTLAPAIKRTLSPGELRWHKIAGGVFLIICFLWGSRGSLVALAAMCLGFFARKIRVAPGRAALILCLLVTAAVGLYFALPPERQQFIDEIPQGLATLGQSSICIQGETSVLAHLTYWREVIRLFAQSPLFGLGAGNFGHYWCGDRIDFLSPHSNILHALVDMGIIGAALWVSLFVSVILLYRRSYPLLTRQNQIVARCLFLIWMFTLLAAQTAGNLFEDYQLYVVTGLLVSALTMESRRIATSPFQLPTGNDVAPPPRLPIG